MVINQDNGPENHSRRTQFMKRMVAFAHQSKININLAYYPPYHSKYNPVERTFGWLEKHWNGSLLDSLETVLEFAKTLTFKGKHPVVTFVEKVYQTGVKLTKQEMKKVEEQIIRLPDLKKWFVSIIVNSD
jgi:Rhodopirellula transposase DDE domain